MARRKIQGGPARPVQVISDADLKQNGGRYIVAGRTAIPVHGLNVGERGVAGGRYISVYPVTQAQISSGEYRLAGGSAEGLYDIALGGIKRKPTSGRQAIPVFVTSGRALGQPSGMTYIEKVLGYSPIAYWPLNEPIFSGAAIDATGNGNDGAYTGVDLGQPGIGDGETCALFDGANDYCNIYSASLRDTFDGEEGTILIWGKVEAGFWPGSSEKEAITLRADGTNRIFLGKGASSNRLRWVYQAGGTLWLLDIAGHSETDWMTIGLTWSALADEAKAFFNGSQTGATHTTLGTWAGNLASDYTVIGARRTTPDTPWDGWLAHAAVWDTPLTPAQMATLAVL